MRHLKKKKRTTLYISVHYVISSWKTLPIFISDWSLQPSDLFPLWIRLLDKRWVGAYLFPLHLKWFHCGKVELLSLCSTWSILVRVDACVVERQRGVRDKRGEKEKKLVFGALPLCVFFTRNPFPVKKPHTLTRDGPLHRERCACTCAQTHTHTHTHSKD